MPTSARFKLLSALVTALLAGAHGAVAAEPSDTDPKAVSQEIAKVLAANPDATPAVVEAAIVDKKAEEKKAAAPVKTETLTSAKAQTPEKTQAPQTPRLPTSDYLAQKDVRAFLKKVSKEKNIPLSWLESEVAVARYSPLTEKYTTPKPNADRKTTPDKNFRLYKRNLVNEERIARGVAFLEENAEAFARAEAETGVSRYAVAAVIGVETIYGKNMGRFRVLDALMTLSFDYPRRAKYYRGELAAFLDFCWQQQVKPVSVKGSFAGAMGLGQFMPSSMEAYGRDGDGDGHIDTVNVPADGILSVANFLKVHGWVKGLEPLFPVKASDAIFKATGSGGIKTHLTVADLVRAGVQGLEAHGLTDHEPVMLVDLPMTEPVTHQKVTEWYVGTRNFAAILRYNRSYFYASAVSMLADAIHERETIKTKPVKADAVAAKPAA